MTRPDDRNEVELAYCPDGPLLVRGAHIVNDGQGQRHVVARPVVAVCLCGKSSRKPWCDGTHKLIPKAGVTRRRALDDPTD
jgi:CDGSH-type Zn-finger protein